MEKLKYRLTSYREIRATVRVRSANPISVPVWFLVEEEKPYLCRALF